MKRYFIDTCVLIWLIEQNKRVKDVIYSIEYYQGDFAISIAALQEFFNMISSGKLKYDIDYDNLIKYLEDSNIEICNFDKWHLKQLSVLPFYEEHKNQYDRDIIAHAIADRRILISGDSDFSLYESSGLKFLEI
jgi:PIN domain nuclease of toxin-antitoxin system